MMEYLWILALGVGLALGVTGIFAFGRRLVKPKPGSGRKPLPMPPASTEDLEVSAEVIADAGEREQGVITDAAAGPRTAAALAKLRRGKR